MKKTIWKKSFVTLTVMVLALAASMIFGLMGKYSASASSELTLSHTLNASAAEMAVQTTGVTLPKNNIFLLNDDNVLFVLTPGATSFTRLVRVNRVNGNLIGIDFRPADGNGNSLYGLTDTGNLYTIGLVAPNVGVATLVGALSTRFAGGFQSLMDFNPVLNALRLIGTNDQNFALVNSSGNLNVTAVQTGMAYAAGDANAGVDPNITGGTYSNNYAGAPNTLFYGIDYDLDTLVTISSVNATGSSNTGGGQLQTIGRLVGPDGAPINFSPTADLDMHTDASGVNTLVGINGRMIFTIDLAQLNPSLALGTTQNVVAKAIPMVEPGGFIDLAISPFAPAAPTPTPTPTPTPAPTPSVTAFQAENTLLGGGSTVSTVHAGFTGTGFVDYADGVAGSFVEFSLSQTGKRTLVFRYANGSTVNRTCAVRVNGTVVGTLSFPPTGAWTTWQTCSLSVNLGAAAGNKAVRITSATTTGGPNLDRLNVQ
jgi:hypothetical protein